MVNDFWNREELYEQVWSEPVTKVAKRYGVSDVAIAKACRKLNIPVPGRGYWARKAHGYRVEQAPLPKLQEVPVVRRYPVTPRIAAPIVPRPTFPVEMEDRNEIERIDSLLSNSAFDLPATRSGVRHPHLRVTRENLRSGYLDRRNILHPPRNEPCLDIRVSKQSVRRAIDIMRSMIAVIEKNAMKVSIDRCEDPYRSYRDSDYTTSLVFLNERVRFAIFERFRRGRRAAAGSAGESVQPEIGVLSIEVLTDSRFFRRIWNDTKDLTLEQAIPQIIAELMRIAVERRRDNERKLQEEQIRSFERREFDRLQRLNAAEEIRAQRLEEAANRWARAKQIRDYVMALVKSRTSQGQQLTPKTALGKWVAWALEQADRLDPLGQSS